MRYSIGTKVRLVRADVMKSMNGAEGVIVGYLGDRYTVDYPGYVASDGTTKWYSAHHQIEPIQRYDGHDVCSWDDCVWQPSREHISA